MSKSQPKISVVIPAYNEEEFLAKTLESLKNQDFREFEIIVVDNNSTDKTAEIAKIFGAKVIFEPKRGVGPARQRGFLAAKGEIVATTDADTILPKNWLSKIFEEFEKDSKLVAFGGLCHLYSGPILVRVLSKIFLVYFGGILWKIRTLITGNCYLIGSNLAVRKSAFLKIGGFNENLKSQEDGDLAERIKKIGKVKFDPKFLVLTSGRRFNFGLLAGFFQYWFNSFLKFIKRERLIKFYPIREERPLVGNLLSFALFFLIFSLIFNFFYFKNPLPAKAQVVKKVENKVSKEIFVLKKELAKEKKQIDDLLNKKSWKKKIPKRFL